MSFITRIFTILFLSIPILNKSFFMTEDIFKKRSILLIFSKRHSSYFLSKDFNELMDSNPELKEQIYNSICSAVIMDYKTDKLGIDDVEISEAPVPEA